MFLINSIFNELSFNQIVSPEPLDNKICYSGFFYKTTSTKLSEWIGSQMSSSSSISNLKKKKSIQSILDYFNKFLDENNRSVFSILFFIEPSNAQIFYLTSEQDELISEFYSKDILFDRDTFELSFWSDFFFNNDYQSVMEVKKDRICTYLFTSTKYREKEIFPVDEIQEKVTKYKPLYCLRTKENYSSNLFSKIETIVKVFDISKIKLQQTSIHQKLITTTQAFQLENNINELVKREADFQKNPDLFIFGNDIIKAIKNYEVKEIFCYEEYKKKIELKISSDFLNFKWWVFPSDTDTQTKTSFINQYNGIIAIRYFVY